MSDPLITLLSPTSSRHSHIALGLGLGSSRLRPLFANAPTATAHPRPPRDHHSHRVPPGYHPKTHLGRPQSQNQLQWKATGKQKKSHLKEKEKRAPESNPFGGPQRQSTPLPSMDRWVVKMKAAPALVKSWGKAAGPREFRVIFVFSQTPD